MESLMIEIWINDKKNKIYNYFPQLLIKSLNASLIGRRDAVIKRRGESLISGVRMHRTKKWRLSNYFRIN